MKRFGIAVHEYHLNLCVLDVLLHNGVTRSVCLKILTLDLLVQLEV